MSDSFWQAIPACRACGGTELVEVCDLGATALADRLGTRPASVQAARQAPLVLVWCPACRLPQLSVDVSPEILYDEHYPYYSSVSPQLGRHFADLAGVVMERYQIGPGSRVVEAASNDGYLLQHFLAAGATVHGFDPATGPAARAVEIGIPTQCSFFGRSAAGAFVSEHGHADLFLANNVLAHVPDLQGFVEGIALVLKKGGHAVIEVPYLTDLVEGSEFDTIYHQHLCYFPLFPLRQLFEKHGLGLSRVTRQAIHGGSLRLELEKGAASSPEVVTLVEEECAEGRNELPFLHRIADGAHEVRAALRETITGIRRAGDEIWAYGAAAKANTLLSWCGLGSSDLVAVADLNPRKHGLYMPGSDLLIEPPAKLLEAAPPYVLILAWNFAEEILSQLEPLRRQGTRFIVPIPQLRFIP